MVENDASLRYPWGSKKDSDHNPMFPVTVKPKS